VLSYTQGGAINYQVGAAGGAPIIPGALGFRASALFTHDGGWIDRLDSESPGLSLLDSNANRSNQKLLRLAFLWQPAEGLKITPGYYYQDKTQNDVTSYWPIYSNPDKNQYYNGNPDRNPYEDHFSLASLKIEGDLGFAALISNTSWFSRHTLTLPFGYEGTTANLAYFNLLAGGPEPGGQWANPNFPVIDGSGIHLPPGLTYHSYSPENAQFRNLTQEVRLQSADPSAKLTWTVGSFFELNKQIDQNWILGQDDENFFQTLTGQGVVDTFGFPELSNPTADWYTNEIQHTRQYALFVDAGYQFTSQWKLDVGLRESWITYDFYSYTAGPQLFAPPQTAGGREKAPSFTPRVNLNFQADQDDLYYFTYAKGFRPGGANAAVSPSVCAQDFANFGLSSTPLSYNSDTTSSYEVGAKNNLGHVAQLATSLYYIKWNGIQQQVVLPLCGFVFTDNFGTAVAKGVDFQGDVRVTDALTFNLAAGYTDARYTTPFKIGPLAAKNAANPGDAIQGSRPFTGSVGLTYRFTAFGERGFARIDDQYQGRQAASSGVNPDTSAYDPANFRLPAINQLNLRAGITRDLWELDAFVNNVADTHPTLYYAYTINPGNGTSRLESLDSSRPRTFGLTFILRR
jgi:outer membrane receptor protein involved in Fe transport